MTFPAEQAFKRDHTLPATTRRVYDYLTTALDFMEVRTVKAQLHCRLVGTNRESFARALDRLVASGYLIEHARDLHGVRRFTLAWSIRADVERAG